MQKINKHVNNLIGLSIAAFVALFLSFIPNLLITKIILAPLFALLAFLVYKYLTGLTITTKINLPKIATQWIVFLAYISAVTIGILIPSTSFTHMYLPWSDLPWINILRGVSAIMLISFLRGFVLVQLIGKWGSSKTEVWFSSFLLSVFITSLIAFAELGLLGKIQGNSLLFHIVDLGLILSYLIKWRKRGKTVINDLTFDLMQVAILLTVIALVYSNILIGLLNSSPLQISDGWNYYGMGYRIYVGNWPTGLQYPWFFFSYLASFYESSGLPSINAYQALHIINIFSVTSFFLMLRNLFKENKEKVSTIATVVFFVAGGFGWLYGMWIRPTLSGLPDYSRVGYVLDATIKKTMDTGTFMPRYLTASESLSFVCLFALIYALSVKTENGSNKFLLSVLCTVSLTIGYLSHFPEMLFFLLFLTILLLFIPSDKLKTTAIYPHIPYILTSSMILIVLFDLLTPSRYYTNNLILLAGPFLSPIIIKLIKQLHFFENKIATSSKQLLKRTFTSRKFKIFFTITFLAITFLYLFSFTIWIGIIPRFQIQLVTPQSYGYSALIGNRVPWYLYPMLLGLPGLFAIAGLHYILKKKKAAPFTILLVIGLTSLVLAGLMRIWPIFEETRIVTRYLWISVSAFAGFALFKTIKQIESMLSHRLISKQIISGSLILLFIIASIPSNLYYTELVASFNPIMGAQLSRNEMVALNWLRINQEPDSRVLTVTSISAQALSAFASSPLWIGDYNKGLNPSILFLNTTDTATLLNLLHQTNTKYVYVAERDDPFFPTNSSIQNLLNFLPIGFENTAAKIYLIPPISAYTKGADSVLINPYPSSTQKGYVDFSTIMLSLSGIPYDLSIPNDYGQMINRRNIVLTTDVDKATLALNDFSKGWLTYGCTSEVYPERVNITGKESPEGFHDFYTSFSSLDTNRYRYASIRWKTSNTTDLYFILQGNNTGFKIINLGTSTSWTNTIINIADLLPSDILEAIFLRTCEQNTTYELKTIKLGASPLFELDITRYTDWAMSGGNLIILGDGLFNGTFANLLSLSPSGAANTVNAVRGESDNKTSAVFPSINVPFIETTSSQTQIRAYYTYNGINKSPYVFQRDFGKGKITYVLSLPYFNAIQTSNETNASALFMQLGLLPNDFITDNNRNFSSSEIDTWAVSSQAIGEVKTSGNVTLRGPYVVLRETPAFNASSIILTHNDNQTQILGGTISKLDVVGDAINLAKATSISIVPPYHDPYINSYITGNFNWTIILSPNATASIDLLNSGKLQNIVINGPCNVTFQNISTEAPFEISTREPTLSVTGQLLCNNLKYAPASPFFISSSLDGNINLTTSLGSQNMITLSKIELKGNWIPTVDDTQIRWNEWQIPWTDILLTPWSITLVTAGSLIVAYIYLKRNLRNRRSGNSNT